MSDITLDCLIIPCGQLHSLTIDKATQRVTFGRSQPNIPKKAFCLPQRLRTGIQRPLSIFERAEPQA
ncbi:hypothetical protein RhiirA1_460740 [Rhizophagus irregularis]|uniref:Uncharacterized protein n=1 Tax=Rhizophagus irregularis TaxID=588596 RepID=A0A2I1E9G2_9GLOM|nr:hypothetical protein RhiirA1_460740 [Rhizophagus irregularis]PKY18733.1 hypothetical protein RhiirB3_431607 [Rhizophagus irregularis]